MVERILDNEYNSAYSDICNMYCRILHNVGLWLLETDRDEFRKKHGYDPKYHQWEEEKR